MWVIAPRSSNEWSVLCIRIAMSINALASKLDRKLENRFLKSSIELSICGTIDTIVRLTLSIVIICSRTIWHQQLTETALEIIFNEISALYRLHCHILKQLCIRFHLVQPTSSRDNIICDIHGTDEIKNFIIPLYLINEKLKNNLISSFLIISYERRTSVMPLKMLTAAFE